MPSFRGGIPFVVAALWALSSVPGVSATVCYTDSLGHQSCRWGYSAWGISLGVLLLIFLLVGVCSYTRHYGDDEVRAVNMTYIPYPHRTVPTTYAANYDPEAAPATTNGPGYQRTRPTSYSTPYMSYDRANEPQYPKTAYPFTGYTVPPPPSRSPSKVHNTVKTKDTTT